jgi:hypothetical protein
MGPQWKESEFHPSASMLLSRHRYRQEGIAGREQRMNGERDTERVCVREREDNYVRGYVQLLSDS